MKNVFRIIGVIAIVVATAVSIFVQINLVQIASIAVAVFVAISLIDGAAKKGKKEKILVYVCCGLAIVGGIGVAAVCLAESAIATIVSAVVALVSVVLALISVNKISEDRKGL
ncbi:hypothetical protein [uncultured Treponema sp.]|uniref:hypothetical protein n=1 Tax=uncultured Treponema sp. TaxID=162155 RepID=UPI0025938BF4|nr:hypothetical protein [uncultured Treponema sp.]